jgi:hypothetical protein
MVRIFILIIAVFQLNLAFAQTNKKPVAKMPGKCHLPADSAISMKLSLEQVKAWADSLPLQVICNDLKNYKLLNFNFTLITANPFQSKDFGIGNGGIPLLARRAINNLQPKDAVILKNATYIDESGKEQQLPVISFSIAE